VGGGSESQSLHGAVAAGGGDELTTMLRMGYRVPVVPHLHSRAARAHTQLHHRRQACMAPQYRPAARHSPATRARRRRARRRRERLLLCGEGQERPHGPEAHDTVGATREHVRRRRTAAEAEGFAFVRAPCHAHGRRRRRWRRRRPGGGGGGVGVWRREVQVREEVELACRGLG